MIRSTTIKLHNMEIIIKKSLLLRSFLYFCHTVLIET